MVSIMLSPGMDKHGLGLKAGVLYMTWGDYSVFMPFRLQNPSQVTSLLERLL